MSGRISSTLTSGVKLSCSSTAIDDVTSAVSVLEYYCSAAQSKVVATVSESISEPSATRVPSRTQPGGSSPSQTETGTTGDKSGADNKGSGQNNGSKVVVIVASVLGSVIAIVVVVGLIWYFKRRDVRKQRGQPLPDDSSHGHGGETDPPKYSGYAGIAELSTPSHTPRPELVGNSTPPPSELPPQQLWPKSELQGDATQRQHLQPTQSPHGFASPTSGHQVSPQSTSMTHFNSPATVSPHQGHHAGYWGSAQGVEAYELATNEPRS